MKRVWMVSPNVSYLEEKVVVLYITFFFPLVTYSLQEVGCQFYKSASLHGDNVIAKVHIFFTCLSYNSL